jgi:hypothetical protein
MLHAVRIKTCDILLHVSFGGRRGQSIQQVDRLLFVLFREGSPYIH